ncbi:MAG: MogA/MoaB family molybdenum cofactor biosynthesis protein [Chloroflexi bacterium]|nr:MogA/MoaB family molybdenum cofactor biosynthesis protein [Chloroflexota bacterium]
MSDPASLGLAAVLTVSDRASRGELEDRAGPAVAALLRGAGFEVGAPAVLPDDPARIADWLRDRADEDDAALLVTAGGTGLTARDRTPQATEAVLDYRVDGIAEAMRAASIAVVPTAMLSRAVAGVRGRTLILNLPGSERGATENLEVVLPVLAHAVAQLREAPEERPPAGTHAG